MDFSPRMDKWFHISKLVKIIYNAHGTKHMCHNCQLMQEKK